MPSAPSWSTPRASVTVKTDAVRQALDYYTRLARFFPADAPAWDDASNNKFLIAGKGSLILNPPSAWAVAKRDAPQVAEQLWTHGMPAGPKGPLHALHPLLLGHLVVRQEQIGGQEPAHATCRSHLPSRRWWRQAKASIFPAFANLTTLKTWAEEGPPKGTLYHYPNRNEHQIVSIAGAPAPPKIAVQIYVQGIMTKMTVRHLQGEPMEKTLAWAETEVEGFLRT